eukprot:3414372-Lingulodinium_polyedra.AAC.1
MGGTWEASPNQNETMLHGTRRGALGAGLLDAATTAPGHGPYGRSPRCPPRQSLEGPWSTRWQRPP